jgi:putative N-acetylmannosamine-6-phosphate epimerase
MINGQLIKSVLLSTDLSYIQNLDTDAIMTVNPFKKSTDLDRVIIEFANKPVFSDIGGGLLSEERMLKLAEGACNAGASGLVITKPTSPEIVYRISTEVDVPIIYTVMFDLEPFTELEDAGVDIFNITTGEVTSETVQKLREQIPAASIMANGGPHESTIKHTIKCGADAIVVNPPTATEILRTVFDGYRNSLS